MTRHKSTRISNDNDCSCITPWKRITCNSLQRFATPKWALFFLALDNFLHHAVISGLYGISISTLEKRFELRSTETGYIAGIYDACSVIGMIAMMVIGDRVNKPKWLGIGTFVMGIGCLIFILPHFIAPEYIPVVDLKDFSNTCGNVTVPDCISSNLRNYRYLFAVALGVLGLGMVPLYAHGITFIDENTSKEKSALYNSIFYTVGGLGPAVGYLGGGSTLKLYTYVGQTPDNIDVASYGWIGAWWLGYLICAIVFVIVSFCIYMLPRKLPETDMHRLNRNTEMEINKTVTNFNMDFLSSVKYLVSNRTLVLCISANIFNFAYIFGFNTFGAKYFEAQLGLSPFHSSLVYGVSAIFAASLGNITSGLVLSKFKLKVRGIIRYQLVCSILSALFSAGIFVHCPDYLFAGGTVTYNIMPIQNENLADVCNVNCGCSTDLFEPVCGQNNVTYFSPCHAGCEVKLSNGYGNCSCISKEMLNYSDTSDTDAIIGHCEKDYCKNMPLFLFFTISALFTSLLTMNPSTQITLRCVHFDLRVRALSFNRILSYSLGTVPGRLISGFLLDMACVVWRTECNEQGSCAVYKHKDMARNMAIILLVETWAMVIIYVFMIILYVPVSQDDKDENIEL